MSASPNAPPAAVHAPARYGRGPAAGAENPRLWVEVGGCPAMSAPPPLALCPETRPPMIPQGMWVTLEGTLGSRPRPAPRASVDCFLCGCPGHYRSECAHWKTRLCWHWRSYRRCNAAVCPFAHGLHELRAPIPPAASRTKWAAYVAGCAVPTPWSVRSSGCPLQCTRATSSATGGSPHGLPVGATHDGAFAAHSVAVGTVTSMRLVERSEAATPNCHGLPIHLSAPATSWVARADHVDSVQKKSEPYGEHRAARHTWPTHC